MSTKPTFEPRMRWRYLVFLGDAMMNCGRWQSSAGKGKAYHPVGGLGGRLGSSTGRSRGLHRIPLAKGAAVFGFGKNLNLT